MGQGLVYNPGPKLDPLDTAVFNADIEVVKEKLKPVYEAIKLVRKELHEGKSLIGFAGAPWTLLRYMMSGSKSNANSFILFIPTDKSNKEISISIKEKLTL